MIRNLKLFILSTSMFFCWQLAGAQNVTIQVFPPALPIEISEQGGTFTYRLSVANNGTCSQQCTVWCMVTTPTGNMRNALQPWTIELAPGRAIQQTFTQSVPQVSPQGTYIFTTNVGVYPNTIWDSDQFTFYKLKPPEWVARYNGPGWSWDQANALAVDGSGNAYITGYSAGSGTSRDYATIKYNSAGVQEWVARYNWQGNNDDEATSLAVDGSGNVYVTGYSIGSGNNEDYATIKYNSAGVQEWVARYSGPSNYYDVATSLAVDGSGNVYVTGRSFESGSGGIYATIKYNSVGVQEWVALYDGSGNGDDEARSLAVDGSGNVYVTGNSYGIGTHCDYATIKYNSAGIEQWVARYNGPGNDYDAATSLAVDDSGNAYVTGYSRGSGTYDDYTTIKYNSAGVQDWVARYNGPGNSYDKAYSLAVDGSGNVYVTGYSYGSGTNYDYATIKYNSAGAQEWVARYNGPGNYRDYAYSLAVDDSGNVYVAGNSSGGGTYYDYGTIKYNSTGVQEWVARYNRPGNAYDEATCLAVDGSGNVYVTGMSYRIATYEDYCTIKYSATDLPNWQQPVATVFGAPAPTDYRLDPCYPNPFNPTTTISYSLPTVSLVNLAIYDLSGKKVTELANGMRDAGVQQVTFDGSALAAGVYFCRLQAGDFRSVQKLALVK